MIIYKYHKYKKRDYNEYIDGRDLYKGLYIYCVWHVLCIRGLADLFIDIDIFLFIFRVTLVKGGSSFAEEFDAIFYELAKYK